MFYVVLAELIFIVYLVCVLLKYRKKHKRYDDQLNKSRAMVESLRVVNHDFKNKMHVLMGFIETDRWDTAKSFINKMRTVPTEEIAEITKVIKISSISSLIVGKVIDCKELGIQLCVMPDSKCEELSDGIKENEYITIIGNLLQNSIEELEMRGKTDRCIDLYINIDKEWTVISVTDNGRGMSDDVKEQIFESGFSTKIGENRGIGLCHVKRICDRYNGKIDIESEPGEGSAITIILRKNGRRC